MKNNNRPPFIYPDYIVQVLNQLMTDSAKNQNGILCKRTDIVNILYNQFNDFPITEQVYQIMWNWINKMLDAGHYNWIKQYWNTANQYYTFKLEYSRKNNDKNKFLEFHVMIGVLLLYKKRYRLLQYIFNFTNTLPAKYPLIPNTFSQIFHIYEDLSEKNKDMYLLKYHMNEVFEGAGEENKIEGLLINYLALLMIRLYDVNDYNVTYSNPLAIPTTGRTFEENGNKIEFANILIERVKKITDEQIRESGLSKDGKRQAIDLLNQYNKECSKRTDFIMEHPQISEKKRNLIRKSLVESAIEYRPHLPQVEKKIEQHEEFFIASQSIELDKRLILDSYSAISSNLGETLINAINSQIQQFYCYQFLLNSAVKNYTIPYCDFSKAMRRLSISSQYAILAMGISNHFFDEIEGFIRKDNKISYCNSTVYEIPSNNEESILIMQTNNIPYYKFRKLENTDSDEEEIEKTRFLFSNINKIKKDNLILTVKQGFSIYIPLPLRYVRLRIAYHLESDDMLIQKIGPVKNDII